MFSKSTVGKYTETNVNNQGSNFLRNIIKSKVYSGDSFIEDRLVQAQLHWQFYTNRHWRYNNDKLLSFNYTKAIVDKINKFLLGKDGFEFNIEDLFGEDVDPIAERRLEALINYNWKRNKKNLFTTKLLQMGGITGDAYVFLYPEGGYVKYKLLDTRTTVPIFEGGDYEKLASYRSVKSLSVNEKDYLIEVTEYFADKTVTFFAKETHLKADRYEEHINEHNQGFIPIVHIENKASADVYGGVSDVIDVVKLNKIYNELAEDVKAIVDYYAQPTTIITGATVGQLRRGISQIWSGLPADANVFNLGLNEDLGASQAFLKLVKDGIHDVSGVPENVLGKTMAVSNTSAAALKILYLPIIEQADAKGLTYGQGIEEINTMTLVMYQKYYTQHPLARLLPNSIEYYNRYIAKPVFSYGLPNDRNAMLNEINMELSSKIGSRREAMERLGKKNIPKILEEIEKDTQEAQDNDAVLTAKVEKAKQALGTPNLGAE